MHRFGREKITKIDVTATLDAQLASKIALVQSVKHDTTGKITMPTIKINFSTFVMISLSLVVAFDILDFFASFPKLSKQMSTIKFIKTGTANEMEMAIAM